MQHIIEILPDTDGTPVPYNPIAKVQWVLVDKIRRVPLFCDSADEIDMKIRELEEQLEEEDRRREEEEWTRVKKYSKLKLYAALVQTGVWDQVEAWLKEQTIEGVNAWTAFALAQEMSSDHPMFEAYLEQIKSLLGMDDEAVQAILKECELDEM